ncbi:hypothetical protein FRC0474_02406 [Corynebacterium diphtheriae]|nr:hypothetical protein FRC0474_02406 [Corynebacterium diphtheriae]
MARLYLEDLELLYTVFIEPRSGNLKLGTFVRVDFACLRTSHGLFNDDISCRRFVLNGERLLHVSRILVSYNNLTIKRQLLKDNQLLTGILRSSLSRNLKRYLGRTRNNRLTISSRSRLKFSRTSNTSLLNNLVVSTNMHQLTSQSVLSLRLQILIRNRINNSATRNRQHLHIVNTLNRSRSTNQRLNRSRLLLLNGESLRLVIRIVVLSYGRRAFATLAFLQSFVDNQ